MENTYNICIGLNTGIQLTTGHHNIILGDNSICEPDDCYMLIIGSFRRKIDFGDYISFRSAFYGLLNK